MPITPDLPFPKGAGDAIRSKDWNDLVTETQRLDDAKVNRSGDAITGSLTIAGALGVNTTIPKAPLHVVGPALVSDGDGSAVPNGHMASGSLTIGSVTSGFGGGNGWNANTAGLLMETLDDTEIAVHDAGLRVASVVRYQSASNSLTIGRDMGWGPISTVVVSGAVEAGNSDLYFTKTDHSHSGLANTAGHAAIENDGSPTYNALMLLGRFGAQVPGKAPGTTARVVRLWDFLDVNGELRVTGNVQSLGRVQDQKIRTVVSANDRIATTSLAEVNMPNMAVTITAAVSAYFHILVQINGVQIMGTPPQAAWFQLRVDGTLYDITRHEFNNNGWELRGVMLSALSVLGPGTHSIVVTWYTTAGGTLNCCWYGDLRQIHVIEL